MRSSVATSVGIDINELGDAGVVEGAVAVSWPQNLKAVGSSARTMQKSPTAATLSPALHRFVLWHEPLPVQCIEPQQATLVHVLTALTHVHPSCSFKRSL